MRAGPERALDQQRIVRLARALRPSSAPSSASCENAADGPRIFPFHGAGAPPPSETLPAFLRSRLFEHDRRIGLARRLEPDHRRQRFAVDPDGGDRGKRGLAIPGGDGGDRVRRHSGRCGRRRAARSTAPTPGIARAGARSSSRDARMRERRAQDHAFELAVMTDVDGVFRRARHLVARLDARRRCVVAVEAAGAGVGHGAEDAVIGAAAAQMSRQRRADFLARRHRRSLAPRASGRETPPPRR